MRSDDDYTAENALILKRATVRADISVEGGAVYEWNTGMISVVAVPDGWHFDPAQSTKIASPVAQIPRQES